MSYSQDPNYWTDDEAQVRPAKRQDTFVPPARVRQMTPAESAALQGIVSAPMQPPTQQAIQLQEWEGTHTGHVRHEDNPVKNAQASLLYSVAYIVVAALAVAAFLLLTGLADGDIGVFCGFEILGTCLVGFVVLAFNRQQGLHHSATGLGHAELKTRERMYETLADVQKHQIDADKEIRLAELQHRRELGQAYLKQLEGNNRESA